MRIRAEKEQRRRVVQQTGRRTSGQRPCCVAWLLFIRFSRFCLAEIWHDRAAWHDRATLVVTVLSCFGIVIRQFLFYLSSPSRIRRSLGFLGFSFCIMIELKIQEWIDLLLSIDRCYRFSTLFTLFFYALIRVSYCLACVYY